MIVNREGVAERMVDQTQVLLSTQSLGEHHGTKWNETGIKQNIAMPNETLSSYSSSLYWMVLLISGGVVVVILGPGLYTDVSLAEWYISWQKQMFDILCHQQLDRTIHLGDVPMAVCSRCTGIYIMFFVNMLFVPLIPQSKWRNKWAIFLVFTALSINLVDFSVNAFDVWENTLTSRFLVGSLIGISAAHLLGTDRPQQPKEIFNHGTK